jgi:thiosulfate/3-mercaptopyruvate sulfurtransferase
MIVVLRNYALKGLAGALTALLLFTAYSIAQSGAGNGPTTASSSASASELAPGSAHVISPEELVKTLQAADGGKPLILNVGPRLLYQQAHIPGAEYIGATSDPRGIEQLRARVKSLPHDRFIVLYCGCCPWSHCPNVRPAYSELHSMGFTQVKVLYVADNFGVDWVDKGYPSVKGQ